MKSPIAPTREQLDVLYDHGAHLVLCRGTGTDPKKAFQFEWQKNAPDRNLVDQHLHRGGWSALMPWSTGLAVVDQDEPGSSENPRQDVENVLGTPLAKNKTRRGWHLWYKPQKPCGNVSWELPNGVSGDIRCQAGYVVLWEPNAVLSAVGALQDAPAIDLDALPRKKKQAKTAQRAEKDESTSPDPDPTWVQAQPHSELPQWSTELLENFLRNISSDACMNEWVYILRSFYEAATCEAGWTAQETITRLDQWSRESNKYREGDSPAIVIARNQPQGTGGANLTTLAKKYRLAYPTGPGGPREGAGRPPGEEPPKSDAERQQDARERKKIQQAADGQAETERLCAEHAAHFVHVEGLVPTVYVQNNKGFWFPVVSVGGHQALFTLVQPPFKNAAALKTIAENLLVTAPGPGRTVGPHDFNQKAVIVFPDAVLDCETRTVLTADEINQALLTPRVEAGFRLNEKPSDPGRQALQRFLSAFNGDRPLRYLLHHRLNPGKHIPILEGIQSDQGKSTLLSLHRELWGDATIVTLEVFGAKNFNMLDQLRADYAELHMDEADKKQFTADRLNSVTAVGLQTINPKMEKPRIVSLRGLLTLACAGPLGGERFDWNQQGILSDANGAGGRLRDLCRLRNKPIDPAYGALLNKPNRRNERQALITALGHHLLQCEPLWPEKDAVQAEKELKDHRNTVTAQAVPEWQNVLRDRIVQKTDGKISSSVLYNLFAQNGVTPPKRNTNELSLFMVSEFQSELERGKYHGVAPV